MTNREKQLIEMLEEALNRWEDFSVCIQELETQLGFTTNKAFHENQLKDIKAIRKKLNEIKS